MKISYAITVCSEFHEIQRLIPIILENKRLLDEVVVLYDQAHGDPYVEEYLRSATINGEFQWHADNFNNDFADWKNKLTKLCTGDWIVNIDADEIPHKNLLQDLPDLLSHNMALVDMIAVPRVNTVSGLTDDHITRWRWNLNNEGWVNWPDFQTRIYKNIPSVHWTGHVHETLTGYKGFSFLPQEERWSFYHPKSIEKQEKQNKYYNTL